MYFRVIINFTVIHLLRFRDRVLNSTRTVCSRDGKIEVNQAQ